MQDEMNADIVSKKRALLVGVNVNNDRDFDKSFEELKALAKANYYEVIDMTSQNIDKVNKALYIGTGKAEEIANLVKTEDIDIVIFNNELSPMQFKNLEEKLHKEVIDRTGLILQIFSDRAKTKEAKLQVSVARLEYMLPRLSHMHSDLGRQGGGAGVSNKGSGEKKIELDRRRIESELEQLKKELEKLSLVRKTQRKKREKSGIKRVALAGYTNAGKSTILNEIIKGYDTTVINDDERDNEINKNANGEDNKLKTVFEKDMLFATLETATRNISLDNNKNFFLSDTVGFIRQLPHNLVKAFRSTLEEIEEADLIVEVIDYSDEDYENHMKVTEKTLKEIGVNDIPILYVFNKSDKANVSNYPLAVDDKIYISAKEKDSIKLLIDEISKIIYQSHVRCKMHIPYTDGSVSSYLNDNATIYETTYDETGTIFDLEVSDIDYGKYNKYIIE